MALKNNALSISKSLQEPSPSYNKHISKYFTKEASVTALPLQTKNPTTSWRRLAQGHPNMPVPEQSREPRFSNFKSAPPLAPVASLSTYWCALKTCVLPLKENGFYRQNTWVGEKWRSYLEKLTVA